MLGKLTSPSLTTVTAQLFLSVQSRTHHELHRIRLQPINSVAWTSRRLRSGKNALNFHVAFELGRIFETAPDMNCLTLPLKNVSLAGWFNSGKENGNDENIKGALHA